MRVLVIGGTGIISTPLTRQLLERGHEVVHYNRGLSPNRTGREVPVIQGDRTRYDEFARQVADAGTFDCVIDMVGFVPDDARSVARVFAGRTNHIIFCSTVDVYTKPAESYPYTENHPRNARGDYGRNKVRCEDVLFEADARGDFHVTSIRPAATYGDTGGSLVHTLGWSTTYFDRLRRGKPIVTHGDGSGLWTACHAEDVARAFVNAVCCPVAYGRAYHAAGEEWLTWNRYHETIAGAMGWPPPRLVHIPTDLLVELAPERTAVTGDNFQFNNIYDNTAARTDLGFRYSIRLAEGARRAIEWMDRSGRIANCDDDPLDDRLIEEWERCRGQMGDHVRDGR